MTILKLKQTIVLGGSVLAGFSVMLGAIHAATPHYAPKNPKDIMRAKNAFTALSHGEAEIVAIGTSHIYRGFDPIVFETLTGRTAYNLSFNGMSAAEMDHMVTLVAKNANRIGTRHVILEGRGFQTINVKNLKTDRIVISADRRGWSLQNPVPFTVADFKLWSPRLSYFLAISKFQRYDFNTRSLDYEAIIKRANTRRNVLKNQGIVFPGNSPLKKAIRQAKSDFSHIKFKGHGRQTREIKDEARSDIAEKYGRLLLKNMSKTPLSYAETKHYRTMIDKLAKQGIKTHIVLPPTISPEWTRTHDKFLHAKKAGLRHIPLYDFRIKNYRETFKNLSLWADHGHLNVNGSKIFSTLLAGHFKRPQKNQPALIAQTDLTDQLSAKILPKSDCEVN